VRGRRRRPRRGAKSGGRVREVGEIDRASREIDLSIRHPAERQTLLPSRRLRAYSRARNDRKLTGGGSPMTRPGS